MKKGFLFLLLVFSASLFAQPTMNYTKKEVCQAYGNDLVESMLTDENSTFSFDEKQVVLTAGNSKTVYVVDSRKVNANHTAFNVHTQNEERFVIEAYADVTIIYNASDRKKYTIYK